MFDDRFLIDFARFLHFWLFIKNCCRIYMVVFINMAVFAIFGVLGVGFGVSGGVPRGVWTPLRGVWTPLTAYTGHSRGVWTDRRGVRTHFCSFLLIFGRFWPFLAVLACF